MLGLTRKYMPASSHSSSGTERLISVITAFAAIGFLRFYCFVFWLLVAMAVRRTDVCTDIPRTTQLVKFEHNNIVLAPVLWDIIDIITSFESRLFSDLHVCTYSSGALSWAAPGTISCEHVQHFLSSGGGDRKC